MTLDLNSAVGISYMTNEMSAWLSTIPINILVLWALAIIVVKGYALWKAARLNEQMWFWVLLLLNTGGILPAIYLYQRRNRRV